MNSNLAQQLEIKCNQLKQITEQLTIQLNSNTQSTKDLTLTQQTPLQSQIVKNEEFDFDSGFNSNPVDLFVQKQLDSIQDSINKLNSLLSQSSFSQNSQKPKSNQKRDSVNKTQMANKTYSAVDHNMFVFAIKSVLNRLFKLNVQNKSNPELNLMIQKHVKRQRVFWRDVVNIAKDHFETENEAYCYYQTVFNTQCGQDK
ncbi:Hypothetical_protein [Hexamita inflata]|uniref:Hypothetical_protein n=1 Tax=Hexamita inflata TaxID=28002 RepID=A0AA86QJC9_9EUKA|nr:Hypothetical protein HINF_LOCUS48214 [Hexamita inflata]